MAISSIREAEYQREGVLRLDMVVEEPYVTYPVTAVIPLDRPQMITIASKSRYMPRGEEVEAAVRKYLRAKGTVQT